MRIAAHYSHLNGLEYLLVHKPVLWDEIKSVVIDIDAESCRTKISEEKTKRGRRLYSPIAMNREFSARFTGQGWASRRTSYWVTEDARLSVEPCRCRPRSRRRR